MMRIGSDAAKQLRAIALRWMEQVWRGRMIDAIDAIDAPNVVERQVV